jgi:hypothetical protein
MGVCVTLHELRACLVPGMLRPDHLCPCCCRCLCSCLCLCLVHQEATLDFFGCAVKAADFSQHLAAMELLAAQVNNLQSELLRLLAAGCDRHCTSASIRMHATTHYIAWAPP